MWYEPTRWYERRRREPYTSGSGPFLGGLVLLGIFGLIYDFESRSKAWPSTPGQVVTAEVTGGTTLQFEYVYSVEGGTFRGSRVSNALVRLGAAKPPEVVRKYPAGSDVLVYYDPKNPRRAILEPGASGWNLVGMVLGLLAIIYGIYSYFTRSLAEIDAHERWHGRHG